MFSITRPSGDLTELLSCCHILLNDSREPPGVSYRWQPAGGHLSAGTCLLAPGAGLVPGELVGVSGEPIPAVAAAQPATGATAAVY